MPIGGIFKASSLLFCAALILPLAHAGPVDRPTVIQPDRQSWARPLGNDSIQALWVLGDEATSGHYLLRVKLAEGARIPPHTHPDTRNTTVLHGSVMVGFGARFDPENMVRIEAGDVYEAPADVPHYLWARDGDVVYQESGHGPSGMQFLENETP